MSSELVQKALQNAYLSQKPEAGIIFHTDFGSQFTRDSFAEMIQGYNMAHSFSYKGRLYDNACIESFHSIFKKKEVHHNRYLDFNISRVALFQYIESWFNRKRFRDSIDYLTPQEMKDLPYVQLPK